MATISQRGKFWRVRIRRKGLSLSRTFDTRLEAEEWAAREEVAWLSGPAKTMLPEDYKPGMTLKDLFYRYAEEVSATNRGERWEILRLKAFIRMPLSAVRVDALKAGTFANFRDDRLKEVEASTVNRELNLLSAVFTHAIKEWGVPIDRNPISLIRRPKNPPPRTRRISDEERQLIVHQFGWDEVSEPSDINEWVAWGFCFALETMMRQGEILDLRWGNVNEEARTAYLPRTKNGESRHVPLSTKALALLKLLTRREDAQRVVPVGAGTFGAYFRRGVDGAGIENLHFHDTRREALTRMSKLLSVVELARASGHSDDLRTLMVYYRPDPTEIAKKLDG